MIKLPKTLPIPAPDPATPTVAAPAPINLAAESMSRLIAVVCNGCTASLLASNWLVPKVGFSTLRIGFDCVANDLLFNVAEVL